VIKLRANAGYVVPRLLSKGGRRSLTSGRPAGKILIVLVYLSPLSVIIFERKLIVSRSQILWLSTVHKIQFRLGRWESSRCFPKSDRKLGKRTPDTCM